jgi:putative nucleotide binding protein
MDGEKRARHPAGNRKDTAKESEGGKKKYEEYAFILDHMPRGHPADKKPPYARDPIIQVIGDTHFTLLELIPKKIAKISIRDKIFIGKGPRSIIDHVKGRISYDELTASAKFELPEIIREIIEQSPDSFVKFFNEARPLTTRMHQLELLPGIGKKIMWDIINVRKQQPFTDFKNISERVRLPDPITIIVKRVLHELQDGDKYRIFTRPPPLSQSKQPTGE